MVVDTEKPDQMPSQEDLPAATLEGQLTAVTAERDQLLAERADLQDRLRRSLADFDNARKRFEQQRSDFVQFAAADLIKSLLPVVDDFERALKVESAGSNYAKGVELIYQRLSDTLKRFGLEPFDSTGARFDPNLHQAVERVQTDDHEDETVLAEFQRGYNFKGKLLRPAMVKVAVKP
jgi:molecular chaperone GrpE